MLITNYVAGPYSGVSQVPPQLRLPDACEAMEDCTAMIPHGVQKRPPLYLVSALQGFLVGPSPLWVEIPRGSPEADVTLLLNNESGVITPRLFLSGTAAPVALTITDAAQAYLNSFTAINGITGQLPNQQFRTVAIEDFTFITNRTVQVVDGTDTAATRNPEAILWVKTGQYGRTYTVTVSPMGGTAVTASFKTPSGDQSSDAQWVDTGVILNQLYQYGSTSGIPGQSFPEDDAAWSGEPLNTLVGFNLVVTGSTLYIQSTTATDFTVTTSDGQGDTAMYAIKGSVQDFSSLPLIGYPGFVAEIAQSAAGGNSDFYVQYSSNGSEPAGGIWTECIAPGAALGVDVTTLPIAITVNETTGVWTCDVVPWTRRTTGDATLSPDPGFIGDYITDVKWWRGRLGLVYNGGEVLSASDSPFKFYTTTLAAALDSDPIGLLTPADRKTFFKQAITFDQRHFLLGDRVQAAVSSGGSPVTPGTTSITLMAQSAFSDLAPVQLGNHKVRYLANRTSSSIVYLLAIDRLSGLALEEDKSAAIPQYIPATIDCAATWEADYVTLWATSGQGQIYVANYREEQYQEIQNAYWRWNLPEGYTVGGFYFKEGLLYILVVSPAGLPLFCTLDITPNQITQGRDSQVSTIRQYLDFMLDDTVCPMNQTATGTNITFPTPLQIPAVTLRTAWNGFPEGYLIPQVNPLLAIANTLCDEYIAAQEIADALQVIAQQDPTPLNTDIYANAASKAISLEGKAITAVVPVLGHAGLEPNALVVAQIALSEIAPGTLIPAPTTGVTLEGDWVGAPIWAGPTYASYFDPTQWYVVGADKKPQHDGRLSLKRLKVDVANYGYLRAEVTVRGRATRLYLFEGYYLDSGLAPIDAPPAAPTTVLNIPLAGKSDDTAVRFIGDTHLGFKIAGYEWRGDWNPTSRRVT